MPVTSLNCCGQIPSKNNLKREWLLLAHSFRDISVQHDSKACWQNGTILGSYSMSQGSTSKEQARARVGCSLLKDNFCQGTSAS